MPTDREQLLAVIAVLKRQFPNLSTDKAVSIALDLIDAVQRKRDEEEG